MGSFGGFYKGDKKKKRKDDGKGSGSMSTSTAPVFVAPKIVEKKKRKDEK